MTAKSQSPRRKRARREVVVETPDADAAFVAALEKDAVRRSDAVTSYLRERDPIAQFGDMAGPLLRQETPPPVVPVPGRESRSVFDDERRQRYLEFLEMTGAKLRGAAYAGVSIQAVEVTVRSDPEFAMAVQAALDSHAEAIRLEFYRRAVTGVVKEVYAGGRRVGYAREYDNRLLKDYADRYGEPPTNPDAPRGEEATGARHVHFHLNTGRGEPMIPLQHIRDDDLRRIEAAFSEAERIEREEQELAEESGKVLEGEVV